MRMSTGGSGRERRAVLVIERGVGMRLRAVMDADDEDEDNSSEDDMRLRRKLLSLGETV